MSKFKRDQLRKKAAKRRETILAEMSNPDRGSNIVLLAPAAMRRVEPNADTRSTKYEGLSLHESNLVILDAAINIFDLRIENWNTIRRTISAPQVRDLYQVVADVWHPDMEYSEIVPEPDENLRALYLGDIDFDADSLTRDILRFGLYTDTIFVVNPFRNPHWLLDQYNPLVRPQDFRSDVLKILYLLLQIEPWIREGVILLVPDPGDFDAGFREQALESAMKRTAGLTPSREEMEEITASSKRDYHRSFLNAPRSYWERIARAQNPGVSEVELDAVEEYYEQQRQLDPLALDLPSSEVDGQFNAGRAGLNLETALYVSESIGAFPYTNLRMRWRELSSVRSRLSEEAQLWTPLTDGFQRLDFNFLNNVDSRFAFEMRDSGRLLGFRTFLRKLWRSLPATEIGRIEAVAKEFREELDTQHRNAMAEWDEIDNELLKWGGSGLLGAGASLPFINGGMKLALPAALSGVGVGVLNLIWSRKKRKQFRLKSPMSVFIDLSKHSPTRL
jgi:hypothetical protein